MFEFLAARAPASSNAAEVAPVSDTHHHHHYHPRNSAIEQKLDYIINLLKKNQEIIMADLTQLQADVAAETTVDQSAITLIESLAAQVTAAGTDPVALKAVTDTMESNAAALAAAVTANTPAAPAGNPAPPPLAVTPAAKAGS